MLFYQNSFPISEFSPENFSQYHMKHSLAFFEKPIALENPIARILLFRHILSYVDGNRRNDDDSLDDGLEINVDPNIVQPIIEEL